MKKRSFFIGPGAPSLMLAVVVVSMSVLGLLALMSARNDARLAMRTGSFTAAQYEAMAASEHSLAQLDALLVQCAAQAETDVQYLAAIAEGLLPEMTLDGRKISWLEPMQEGHALSCAVEVLPLGAEPERCRWVEHLFVSGEMDDE